MNYIDTNIKNVRFKKTTKEDAKIILELIKELATYEKCERFEWYAQIGINLLLISIVAQEKRFKKSGLFIDQIKKEQKDSMKMKLNNYKE